MNFTHKEFQRYFDYSKDTNKKELDIFNLTADSFSEWALSSIGIYERVGYIEVDNTIRNEFNKKFIIGNKTFVRYYIYKFDDTNLELYELKIEQYTFNDISLNNIHKKLDKIIKNDILINLDDFHLNNYREVQFKDYLNTNDEWYSNFIIDNQDKCLVTLMVQNNNINIHTIIIEGDDDYSLSKDFLSMTEARKELNYLHSLKFINKSNLIEYYFSN
jgi:hypothetical protein